MSSNIERVDPDRWESAQQWERAHWVNAQKHRARYGKNWIWRALAAVGLVSKFRGDDWNGWWKDQFEGYRFVPEVVPNAIEVGCGPYSNIRLMQDRTRMDHLVLSDPLIRTYVTFKLAFVAEMHRKAACMIDDHPLEELPFASNYFDLAVMINVLDHVRDAAACMDRLVDVVRPGGILIVGQDLSNDADVAASKGDTGEVGHPIKLEHQWFERWLGKNRFDPIISKVLTREQGRAPSHHYGTLVFAGRKKPVE